MSYPLDMPGKPLVGGTQVYFEGSYRPLSLAALHRKLIWSILMDRSIESFAFWLGSHFTTTIYYNARTTADTVAIHLSISHIFPSEEQDPKILDTTSLGALLTYGRQVTIFPGREPRP